MSVANLKLIISIHKVVYKWSDAFIIEMNHQTNI